MKSLLLQMLLIAGLSSPVFAQKTIDERYICESGDDYASFGAVDSFKDSLTLTLKITKAFDTHKTYKKEIVYTERFKNETSIIQIAPTVALQIIIVRVEIAGKKYYLRAEMYYIKQDGCWVVLSNSPSWSKMNLSSSLTGGSYNGVGFDGEVTIR